jgi:peroxiredoxin
VQCSAAAVDDHTLEEAGMRADLVVGGRFPDLELPDHRRESVKVSKLADGFPLIVCFYRGYW